MRSVRREAAAPDTPDAAAGHRARAEVARSAAAAAPGQAPTEAAEASSARVVIITGLSGAGKSQASKLFEDLGYYCVDNLPPALLDAFVALRDAEPDRYRRTALVLDIRAGDPAPAIEAARRELRERGVPVEVVYLEASDAVLISRFSETRHRHPLEARAGVQAGIADERMRLASTRELADTVIDTSGLNIGQLKERLSRVAQASPERSLLDVDIVTFGFKHGLPLEADLVFDVRFLTNPYYVADLKALSGLREEVRDYVLRQPQASRFLDIVEELLELTLPAYVAEGKARLTVALGCTGGYHRSIVLAEELAARLRRGRRAAVSVFHRELEK
jgi:UPF0042 nucleotide-binding protein